MVYLRNLCVLPPATSPQQQCCAITKSCCSCATAACLLSPADPPAGDVGSNVQEAACPVASAPATLARPGNGYAYGQALTVVGSIPPAAAGLKVRGQLALPVGVLSAECLDLQQVGYMMRVPASLKVRLAKQS